MTRPAILHIGFGAFHKAHQAVYIQALADQGLADWQIYAVNLRAADSEQFAIEAAGGAYNLTTYDQDGVQSHQQVDRHTEFFDWARDAGAATQALTRPEVSMVTITVSEAGYYFDTHGALEVDHPVIAAELAGGARVSIYAYLSDALQARRQAGGAAVTILCCDNLRNNGSLLHQNFKAYLQASDQLDLLSWVQDMCRFPCSMVDRITPAPVQRAVKGDTQGTAIVAESYIQWVVEDAFVAARPPFEQVGVEVVEDVHPYEEAKIRVLNGGHTALTYLGALAGHDRFDEAMADPDLREHFANFERHEVEPAMPAPMPLAIPTYIGLIEDRFTNKSIADSIERICTDGFAKFGIFIRPTLEGCFALGQVPVFTIRSIAAWFHYARLKALGARDYRYNEPNWDRLAPLLDRQDPSAFLSTPSLFGDLAQRHPEFTHEFERQLQYLEQKWPA